jgi:hypothetical protein
MEEWKLPERGDPVPTRSRKKLRAGLAVLLVVLAALAAYAAVPRHASLTKFDPAETARLETLMWRHYYDKRFVALFGDLYRLARDQQGFSPLDSARIAVAAARAARSFQPTVSRREALVAVPLLADYFTVLASAAPEPVNIVAAARSELDWWQARREAVPPETYGLTIARVATLLYGVDGDEVETFGVLRAKAMAYRDAREAHMAEADWAAIEEQLASAYWHLKQAVSRRTKFV